MTKIVFKSFIDESSKVINNDFFRKIDLRQNILKAKIEVFKKFLVFHKHVFIKEFIKNIVFEISFVKDDIQIVKKFF